MNPAVQEKVTRRSWVRHAVPHSAATRARLAELSRGNTNRRKFHKIIASVELKHCKRCDTWKSLDQYFKHSSCWDGLTTWCKTCTLKDTRDRYFKNPEKVRVYTQKRIERNPEAYRFYMNNKAKVRYHKVSKYSTKYRVCASIRAGIYASIKGTKNGRRWRELVGYSLEDLISHLGRLLHPGMTLANFGEWHIDHIRPIASFEFNSPDDPGFKECWALQNLQPLWATENMAKGARYESRI